MFTDSLNMTEYENMTEGWGREVFKQKSNILKPLVTNGGYSACNGQLNVDSRRSGAGLGWAGLGLTSHYN